jgi:hypothetical protein
MTNLFTENERRRNLLSTPYNPETGEGSLIDRFWLEFSCGADFYRYYLPVHMQRFQTVQDLMRTKDVDILLAESFGDTGEELRKKFLEDFFQLRLDEDFEFWAWSCVVVKDKKSSRDIRFKLKRPQRKFLTILENERISNRPIRIRLCKSRQWGGSTLTQIYGLWLQLRHRTGWNMAICANIENQAKTIRAMTRLVINNYPKWAGEITMARWEGTDKHKYIPERDCSIQIGSMQKPDALRANAFKVVHLSEVGLWEKTDNKTPEDMITALTEAVVPEPYTMIVEESTAKGVGNYFHTEWLASIDGKSVYVPVFVAWYEDETSTLDVDDIEKFFNSFNEYEKYLWNDIGCCIEQIAWYRFKLKEKGSSTWRMMEENPTTWQEAFQNTGMRVFPPEYVQKARKNNRNPIKIGDIVGDARKGKDAFKNLNVYDDTHGLFYFWILPPDGKEEEKVANRFVVSVDIGGRTKNADFSVIRVFDKYWMTDLDGKPEIAATWKGHIDQDLLAWKAAQTAKMYDNALLVIEFNSLDTDDDTEGDHSLTVLNEISEFYNNLYYRNDPAKVKEGEPIQYGFHTNKATKPMIVDFLLAALRDESYYERDSRACDEFDLYEMKEGGKLGAVDGKKDDIVMSTSIGLWVCYRRSPAPVILKNEGKISTKRAIVGDATV